MTVTGYVVKLVCGVAGLRCYGQWGAAAGTGGGGGGNGGGIGGASADGERACNEGGTRGPGRYNSAAYARLFQEDEEMRSMRGVRWLSRMRMNGSMGRITRTRRVASCWLCWLW